MDMNTVFEEILKIADKIDTNGNTKDNPIGNLRLGNNKYVDGVLADGSNIASLMGLDSNDNALFGGIYRPTIIRSSVNPKFNIGGREETPYHTGYKPSANDVGTPELLFSGTLDINGAVTSSSKNKNNCMLSTGVFTVPTNGTYLFVGVFQKANTIYLMSTTNSSTNYVLTRLRNYTCATDSNAATYPDTLPFTRAVTLNSGTTWNFLDANRNNFIWLQLNIIKLN